MTFEEFTPDQAEALRSWFETERVFYNIKDCGYTYDFKFHKNYTLDWRFPNDPNNQMWTVAHMDGMFKGAWIGIFKTIWDRLNTKK